MVNAAVLVIGKALPNSGAALGRPGEAEGGTRTNDREAGNKHRGTRAVTVATVLFVMRSGRERAILEALENVGASSEAESAKCEFSMTHEMGSRIATNREAEALVKMRSAAYQNRGRLQRRTSRPHPKTLMSPCCLPACVLS